jgi:hypothetical protein
MRFSPGQYDGALKGHESFVVIFSAEWSLVAEGIRRDFQKSLFLFDSLRLPGKPISHHTVPTMIETIGT